MAGRGKTEKISVTLPKELVRGIKDMVSQGEVSSFFTEALEHYLAYHRQRIALERGFGAWKSKNHPDLKTPEDATVYVRNIRKAGKERLTQFGGSVGE